MRNDERAAMMRYIVYSSNTGHTERYARLLSEAVKLPFIDVKEMKKYIRSSDEIIYLGWVCANRISGYTRAAKRGRLLCVAAVGMNPESMSNTDTLKQANCIDAPFFYLQGGVDYSKLKGIKRHLLKMVSDNVIRENKPENAALIAIFKQGGDFVSADFLRPMLRFLNAGEK